uniref:Uncharacterized protein n=1 Tax=Oryza sativa subsp. japonica TaxID=39947 RepID=Q2QUE4_ORYSJ|nr:hypothetical protein LOC_Os12g16530 [Oryza sativa Japonica Group]
MEGFNDLGGDVKAISDGWWLRRTHATDVGDSAPCPPIALLREEHGTRYCHRFLARFRRSGLTPSIPRHQTSVEELNGDYSPLRPSLLFVPPSSISST